MSRKKHDIWQNYFTYDEVLTILRFEGLEAKKFFEKAKPYEEFKDGSPAYHKEDIEGFIIWEHH